MNCLLCGRPVTTPGDLYDSPLCQAAHAEQRRVRFAPGSAPPQVVALIDKWIGGRATAEEEAEILEYLGKAEEEA